jgi:hypothetical protein
MSDDEKDTFISNNLPSLKTAVSSAISKSKVEIAKMYNRGKNGGTAWNTDTDTWKTIIFDTIADNFDDDHHSGFVDALKTSYASDASYYANLGKLASEEMALKDTDHWELYMSLYEASDANAYHEYTGVGIYEKNLKAASGNYDDMVLYQVHEVLLGVEVSTEANVAHWASFKATGFLGAVDSDGVGTAESTSGYGCGETTEAALIAAETSGSELIYHTCLKGTEAATLMGGFFYSHTMGTYESFILHLPTDYCSEFAGETVIGGKDIDIDGQYKIEYFLYLMHGWGESGYVLVEAAGTIEIMQSEDMSIDFLTICAEDSGSPYGGKTWYVNNLFTGYHMDMIVFELPDYVERKMALLPAGKGVFGFSMGAAGSLNIGFTYGNVYSGVAAFNGPIAPDKCFFYGTCHTYCGLDSFKCEIMWTSSQAAYNPYILMAAGGMLNSDGYYDPVAMAIATLATQYGIAQCAKTPNGGLYVQSTVDGELVGKGTTYCDDVYYMHGYEVCISDGGGWADLFHGAWDMLELTSDSTGWTDNAYFYLDASLYAVSSQGFYPSHNPMTGVVNPAQYYNMKYQFPLYRAETNKQMFDMKGGHLVFMLIACDINDQYGLAAMAQHSHPSSLVA